MPWIIGSFYNNLIELKQLISQHQPQIVCIQESHLKPKSSLKLNQYILYFHDQTESEHASKSVITAIHNSIVVHKTYIINSKLQHITLQS